ncbi:MAG: CsbD family protein [uncultured Aureispira sp.]|uniref:CsbD family protein n=1 Tax=uncultured Aureispira sp. TaxID=1331704 RepID=A0A6S6STU4_9BACT|nr:MAG: CsbD family protein [uncultured Aureispira sp.]
MSVFSDKVHGNWNEIKGKMKQEYAELTDNDLMYEKGKEDEMLGLLQQKLGKTKEDIKRWIDSIGN